MNSIVKNKTEHWLLKPVRKILLCCALGTAAMAVEAGQLPAPIPKSPISGTVNVDPQSAFLQWSTVAGATGYEWRLLLDGNVIRTATLAADHNYRTVKDLDFNTTYGWRVRALQGANAGQWMATVPRFTTLPPLSAPGLVSPLNQSDYQGLPEGAKIKVKLTWNAIPGNGYYQISYSKNPNGPFETRSAHGTTAELLFEAGTTYYWYVQGTAVASVYPKSQTWAFKTIGTLPVNLSPKNDEEISWNMNNNWMEYDFKWTHAARATAYKIRFYEQKGKWIFPLKEFVTTTNTLHIHFSDDPQDRNFLLPPCIDKYFWEVVAVTPVGEFTSQQTSFYYLGCKPERPQAIIPTGPSAVTFLWKKLPVQLHCYELEIYRSELSIGATTPIFSTYGIYDRADFDPHTRARYPYVSGLYFYRTRAVYDNRNYGDSGIHKGPWSETGSFFYPYP